MFPFLVRISGCFWLGCGGLLLAVSSTRGVETIVLVVVVGVLVVVEMAVEGLESECEWEAKWKMEWKWKRY